MQAILSFLKELEVNNNREWFHAHKPEFNAARASFEKVLGEVLAGLANLDPRVRGVSPADAVFRIYRDTRFSHDKTPYKNNFGAFMSKGGRKSAEPGYYFHIQPGGESFLSGGIYMPSPDRLKAVRKEIYLFPEDFSEILNDPFFRENFRLFEEDKLKRPPLGFPADFPLIDYLKYKHYCPWYPLSDEWLTGPDLAGKVVEVYSRMMPFNNFIYRALED